VKLQQIQPDLAHDTRHILGLRVYEQANSRHEGWQSLDYFARAPDVDASWTRWVKDDSDSVGPGVGSRQAVLDTRHSANLDCCAHGFKTRRSRPAPR
jgi:hypothetical protein